MAALCTAGADQIDSICRESHALWGAGLTPSDYREMWDDLGRTAWARKHARFLVLEDDGAQALTSLKLYRPTMLLGSKAARGSVIGAIFTPRAQRRRGYAAALLRKVLDECRERGDRIVLLFSDIGTRFYGSLGFVPLAAEEHWGSLSRVASSLPSGWTLRPVQDQDRAAVRRAHDDTARRRRLALIRDEEHWNFLDVRSGSYFRRLGDARVRSRFLVALHHGQFVGYLQAVEGHGEWNVREVGAWGGDPEAMESILRAGAADAKANGLRRFYGWLPPEAADRLDDWKMRRGPRRRAVPMVLPLEGEGDEGLRATFIPYQDQF